jgi:hypothetical protein
MPVLRVPAVALSLVAWAGAAVAAQPDAPASVPPKTVSELVVTAIKSVSELVVTAPAKCPSVRYSTKGKPAPKVVSTFPADGQTIRPGLMVVRVTFDHKVACAGGLSDDPPLANPCPDAVQHMVLSFDNRTVRTICIVDPGRLYSARLNRYPDTSFRSLDGVLGETHQLKFSTSMDPPVTDLCEALREDTETIAEVEAARPLDCASRDAAQDLVKAQVLQRDTRARQEREIAIANQRAKADAARAEAEVRDLQKAEKLALAAYRTARDREWSRQRELVRDERAYEESPLTSPAGEFARPSQSPTFDRHTVDSLTSPVLPPGAAASARQAELKPKGRPEFTDWRQSFQVNGAIFDCRYESGGVVCQRRGDYPSG